MFHMTSSIINYSCQSSWFLFTLCSSPETMHWSFLWWKVFNRAFMGM